MIFFQPVFIYSKKLSADAEAVAHAEHKVAWIAKAFQAVAGAEIEIVSDKCLECKHLVPSAHVGTAGGI